MSAYSKLLSLLLLSVTSTFFAGCGGTGSPVPASSSATSEAADAKGGENKAAGAETEAPNKGAESAEAPKDKESPTEEKGK